MSNELVLTAVDTPANYGDTVFQILDKSPNGITADQSSSALKPVYGRLPVGGRRNLLNGTENLSTQSVTVDAQPHTLRFTGSGSISLSGVHTETLQGTGAGEEVEAMLTPSAGTLTLTVSGEVTQAQLEQGSSATAYQRVTNPNDVFEAGSDHIEYLRFDHTDDTMTQTFPDGLNGDLIVCGTAGSWVDEGVSVAAGGDLTIGPRGLPNTAHILPALGDIIGWVPVDRTLSGEERSRIIDYYKGRGAKGRLVPSGVELVTNGTFDTDVSGWEKTTTYPDFSISSVDGQLKMEGGDPAGTAYGAKQSVALESGKFYKLEVDLVSAPSNRYIRLLDASGGVIETLAALAGIAIGSNTFIFDAPANAKGIGFYVFRDGVAVLDNISIQELIPEEELV